MSESSNHWSQVRSVAAVVCDGLLAMRAQRREQRRAAQEEAAVPPNWRVRPPAEPAAPSAPEQPRPAPAAPPHEPRPTKAPEPALSIEPLTLPLPVAPWDMPRSPASRAAGRPAAPRPFGSETAVESTRASSPPRPIPVESMGASSPLTSIPPSSSTQPEPAPASGPSTQGPEDLTQLGEMVGNVVNLLGDVIGDVVGDALAENSRRVEQRRTHEQENLARTIEAVMERQEDRFREALEQQAQAFAAALDRHVELQAESLKTILREVLHEQPATSADEGPASKTAEGLQELQETLRLGFGEVRTALDRHHRELMEVVRTELRPLAKAALTHLTILTPPRTNAPSPAIPIAESTTCLRAPPVAPASKARVGPETSDDAELASTTSRPTCERARTSDRQPAQASSVISGLPSDRRSTSGVIDLAPRARGPAAPENGEDRGAPGADSSEGAQNGTPCHHLASLDGGHELRQPQETSR